MKKKLLAMMLGGITCLSSFSIFGDTKNLATSINNNVSYNVNRTSIITPQGGTGWTGGYGDVHENDSLYVMGEKMPAKIDVYIRDGLFVLGRGSTKWTLSVNQSSNEGIFLSSKGCDIINNPSWDRLQSGHKYSTLLRIQGSGSQTESRTLSFNAALELLQTGAVKMSIPGVGEVSTETQLKAAFGGSASKTVSVTMDTGYKSYHGADFTVEGFEKINFVLD